VAPRLVIHGHFYQPPRENPWTEEVSREASAAPAHDWNQRVAAEAYRPNAWARIFDDAGRVVDIVNNYRFLSFDVGPTLMAWLARHQPAVHARIVQADTASGSAMAQAYGHTILPLAGERDVRTQVRWGLADFLHRFGRPAQAMWLPEAAVNEQVLAILVEEGVGATVLAQHQAARVRPLGDAGARWTEVIGGRLDIGRPWRWLHPDGSGRGLDIAFYDGALSHVLAFEMSGLSSEELVNRVAETRHDGLVVIAADGETFGHHHRWGERLVAHALAVEAPRRGIAVGGLAAHFDGTQHAGQVQVRESSWSCAHGVGRWREDCGCSTGGEPGWNQRWRAPLRQALDLLQERVDHVFERRGAAVLADPWAARDAYLPVVLGVVGRERFAADHVTGDVVEALTLLEAQRAAMAMYTSCGWFFNDLAGLETVQVLRYAARAMDLLGELGEDPGTEQFLAMLDKAESNRPEEGTGRDVWRRHVEPARVGPGRAAAHLALVALFNSGPLAPRVGVFAVEPVDHQRTERSGLVLVSGAVGLVHARTGRRSGHLYAALHLAGLEVAVFTRAADPDRDAAALARLRHVFGAGANVAALLHLAADDFGPDPLGLSSALPDAADDIVAGASRALADRFAAVCEQFYGDHAATLEALAAAGSPLPAELRAAAELALARRLAAAVAAGDEVAAKVEAAKAAAAGLAVDTPELRAKAGPMVEAAVEGALAGGSTGPALALLGLATGLGLHLPLDRPQELVHEARRGGGRPDLDELAAALGLAPLRR
jgi:hypothetical protein